MERELTNVIDKYKIVNANIEIQLSSGDWLVLRKCNGGYPRHNGMFIGIVSPNQRYKIENVDNVSNISDVSDVSDISEVTIDDVNDLDFTIAYPEPPVMPRDNSENQPLIVSDFPQEIDTTAGNRYGFLVEPKCYFVNRSSSKLTFTMPSDVESIIFDLRLCSIDKQNRLTETPCSNFLNPENVKFEKFGKIMIKVDNLKDIDKIVFPLAKLLINPDGKRRLNHEKHHPHFVIRAQITFHGGTSTEITHVFTVCTMTGSSQNEHEKINKIFAETLKLRELH
jgi:hypothetical protein